MSASSHYSINKERTGDKVVWSYWRECGLGTRWEWRLTLPSGLVREGSGLSSGPRQARRHLRRAIKRAKGKEAP